MHSYRVTQHMDIHEFVHTGFSPLAGPPPVPHTYLVSKELVAYLETLIAFTPYYRADDSRMSGKMEHFYLNALSRYKQYPYEEFHKYITKKLTSFYSRFEPCKVNVKEEAVEAAGSPKEGDVVEAGTLPAGSIVGGFYAMSGSEDEDEEAGAAAAGASPAAAAAVGPAAAEAAPPAKAAAADAATAVEGPAA